MKDACRDQSPAWLRLEALVAEIQRELTPQATVTHNATLRGFDSETNRQIDVLIEQYVGQFPIRIVVDCKDYKVPVDVKGVEEFYGLVRDVQAHQGSLVSAKGFSKAAKTLAKRRNIALYSLVDTAPHKWQSSGVAIPVICDFRTAMITVNLMLSLSGPGQYVVFCPPPDWSLFVAYGPAGNSLGSPFDQALIQWDSGKFPLDVGEHTNLPVFSTQSYVDNGEGTRIPMQFLANVSVAGERYFGYLPLEDVRGLRDEQTGRIHTNAFTTGGLDPVIVEQEWTKISVDEEPPLPPAITIMGLVGKELRVQTVCFNPEGVVSGQLA